MLKKKIFLSLELTEKRRGFAVSPCYQGEQAERP